VNEADYSRAIELVRNAGPRLPGPPRRGRPTEHRLTTAQAADILAALTATGPGRKPPLVWARPSDDLSRVVLSERDTQSFSLRDAAYSVYLQYRDLFGDGNNPAGWQRLADMLLAAGYAEPAGGPKFSDRGRLQPQP
jgi:hypothetical protein